MLFGSGATYSNVTDPVIPEQLSGVIGNIGGLDNFLHAMAVAHRGLQAEGPLSPVTSGDVTSEWFGPAALLDPGPRLPSSGGAVAAPVPNVNLGGTIGFGPQDLYSFYDENLLISAGVTGGGGDCIAIVGDSDFTPSAVDVFNSQFGLPAWSIKTVLVDGTNPGINGDELEALLDLEWSHAVAPGDAAHPATTRFYLGDPATPTPITDAIQSAVSENVCGTISISFGLCGGSSTFYTGTMSPIYAQAAAQGQSIFLSTGDWGAAGLVPDPSGTVCVPGSSPNINELGGDPIVTNVGGTMFTPNYDASGNNVSHVAELAWDAVYSSGQFATGGGASAIYPKPVFQKGTGVPADGSRDVPDVALIAALTGPNGPGVFVGFDDGFGSVSIQCCVIGTSLSAPAWAGISKLIAQLKKSRPGPLNPTIMPWPMEDWQRQASATSPRVTMTTALSPALRPGQVSI